MIFLRQAERFPDKLENQPIAEEEAIPGSVLSCFKTLCPDMHTHKMSTSVFLLPHCVCVCPVLTPPESEKADSEERVSLKVCISTSSPIFPLLFLLVFFFPFLLFSLLFLQACGSPLHAHLRGSLQVPASGEQRFGTPVSPFTVIGICVCSYGNRIN